MSVVAKENPGRASAAERVEEMNTETAKLHAWIRTQANAPAQRPWFTDMGETGGTLAKGRVAANQMKMLAHRWRWREIYPYLRKISEIATEAKGELLERTDRQGILLTNPGLGGRLQITNTIRCAVAIYNHGDIAPAHVHSPNASRTILSDKGGYTNVEGERCECRRGDIVFTPNGTWHDHGNDDPDPMIWIDMLDWPLMEYLDSVWVDQDYIAATQSNTKSQATKYADGHSTRMYGHGGLKPVFASNQRGWGQKSTPNFHYKGVDVMDALTGLRGEEGDPFEGIKMQFVNPVTGGPVFASLDYCAQLLRPGEELALKRETSSTFIVVMEGEGFSEIGGQRFDWEKNDILAVPNFLWRRHVNTGKNDAVLYTVSDAALMRALGQYRAQGKTADGSVTQIER
ncbi:MAG TPA: cupin domain-containing protein [Micropepsaceae bacterium]|jgi:gentisate 1,2-dioxygenase